MNKKPDPEMIDDENPEWGDAEFASAKKFTEMPAEFQAVVRKVRGPQKSPTKQQVTLRLSPDVLEGFKGFGQGWQTLLDTALREWLQTHQKA